MRTFSQYFIYKELGDVKESIISESTLPKEIYISRFYEKFPRIQYEDVEDAFEQAISLHKDEREVRREMEKILSELNKKKRDVRKNLSCVRAIKSAMGNDPIQSLMKRASRMLTNLESKVLQMCTQGKSVRAIGKEMGISSATAWRNLNSAIDKIRISHGMKSRNMDRR